MEEGEVLSFELWVLSLIMSEERKFGVQSSMTEDRSPKIRQLSTQNPELVLVPPNPGDDEADDSCQDGNRGE